VQGLGSWKSCQNPIFGLCWHHDPIHTAEKEEHSSPEEAGAYVRTLQAVLRAVGSSDGNMEQVS
jgi:hypothetical protein